MKQSTFIFVSDPSYGRAWQALSIGLTAAAMGSDVTFVFAFEALRALTQQTYGSPVTPFDVRANEVAVQINAPSCSAMLRDARALGARIVACETIVRLCEFDADELTRTGILDAVQSLPQIWRGAAVAQVFNF